MKDQTPIDRNRALYSFRSLDTVKLREIAEAEIAQGTLAAELSQAVLDERAAEKTFFALSSNSYDVIRLALYERIERCTANINVCHLDFVGYWYAQLWTIELALRELGIDS